MASTPTDQCIVLPFRPHETRPFEGSGLALHFLLGNVLVLHTGLKEMWFGWRVKKIFPQKEALQKYCRDASMDLDLASLSREQKVRRWLHGSLNEESVHLRCFDGENPAAHPDPISLKISLTDGLTAFRSEFMAALASLGWPMPQNQIQSALWPEALGRDGLDAVGQALERFYIYSAYGGDGQLDEAPFKHATAVAPESFMAHDLYGWALYRNQNYRAARGAFLTSLRINPAGAGAMSGLMWCGVYGKDLEEAMFWSGRKADVCRQDVQAAREDGRRRYEKTHSGAGVQP